MTASSTDAPAERWPAGRYALWLTGPLILLCLITKSHKLARMGEGGLGPALGALFLDLVFGAALIGGTYAALRWSGRARPLVRLLFHLLVLALTLLVFIEHGFWAKTGTLIDAHTLAYGLEHLSALWKVYLSEMNAGVWLGFAAVLGLQLLPWLAFRRGSSHPRAFRAVALVALIAPACTGLFRLTHNTPGPMAPLTGNVVTSFAADLFSAAPPALALREDFEELSVLVAPARADAPRQNVIVIVLESLRASATSLSPPHLDTTPFLKSLAERAAVVDTTWPAVIHTSKALVGVLCGLFPNLDTPIDEAGLTGLPGPCLARILRERGYATAFMQTATAHFERRDQLVRNMGYETFASKETLPSEGFEETSYFGWEDQALVQPALDWIAAQEAPFFLTLLTLSTHHDYKTPSRFPKRSTSGDAFGDYLDAVRYLDTVLASLFAGLEAAGRLDDTLVVLIGDHGEAFGEHGRHQHDTVIYEETLHIPMMVLGPGVPQGRIGGLRHAVDVLPTALDWLGSPVTGLPGRSLLSTPGHPQIFASCWLRQRCIAVREGALKYIWHFDRQPVEVFDLEEDPGERRNLHAQLAPALTERLRDTLLEWKARNDQLWARFFSFADRDFVSTKRPEPSRPLDLTFSADRDLVRLIGVDGPTSVPAGEPLRLTLHWEVLDTPGEGWQIFTHLLGEGPGARPFYNADHIPVSGRHPAAGWAAGTYVSDPFRIQPDPPLPPGRYTLVVGLWHRDGTPDRAQVRQGEPHGPLVDNQQRVHVLEIEVLPP